MDENEKKIVNFIDEIRGQTHELEIPLNISANTLIIALKRAYDLNLDEIILQSVIWHVNIQ